MKTFKTTAIVALMTAAVGLSAIAPAFAQDTTPPVPPAAEQAPAPERGPMAGRDWHGGEHRGGPRGMAGFIGFERGAEAVEIALVRLSYAIDMTTDQQALFDTLRTDALAAAEGFSTAIDELRASAPAAGERPGFDIPQALDTRIAIGTAQLEALKAVQPSLTAFFDSLTDEQKAELAPEPRGRGAMGERGERGERHERGGRDHKGQRDGRGPGPMDAPAIEAPAAPAND